MDENKVNSQPESLKDDDVESTAGGYKQTIKGWSYGEIIKCPSCGNANSNSFYCDGDELASLQKDLYTCAICGQEFAVASGYGITDIF
ncbi:MAG: hypothetical protein IJU77_13115 [Butyrivibrio sp.]|nr:hypothetical protein [Butyrivibrio sp.]